MYLLGKELYTSYIHLYINDELSFAVTPACLYTFTHTHTQTKTFFPRILKVSSIWLSQTIHIIYLYMYLPNPSGRARFDTRLNFQQSSTGLNSKFSFSDIGYYNSLSYYLPITGRRIIRFLSFQRRGCPRGVMVKAMDCGIVVSEFLLQSFTFGQIPLGKVWIPLSSQLWVK